MNVDKENPVKQCATCLDYQHTHPQEMAILHQLPCKLWEVVVADIFSMYNNIFVHCRLLQQDPHYEEGLWLVSRQPIQNSQECALTVFTTKENCFTCRH